MICNVFLIPSQPHMEYSRLDFTALFVFLSRVFSGLEVLWIVLRRLAYPCQYVDLCHFFHRQKICLLFDLGVHFHLWQLQHSLVSWCFEPSQPQRITTGAEHKLHSISKLVISQVIIPQSHVFSSLFIFRGHSTREPASSRVTYFILRAYTVTMC